MLQNFRMSPPVGDNPFPYRLLSRFIRAAVLTKIAKHLALLACLLIIRQNAGWPSIHPVTIFLLIVLAALLNSVGNRLRIDRANTLRATENRR
jgi:hypothetical protein